LPSSKNKNYLPINMWLHHTQRGKRKLGKPKKKKVFTHTLLTPTQHKTNLAPYKPKWSNHPTKTKTKKTELPPSPMVSLLSTK
jgi:hypothetical protein